MTDGIRFRPDVTPIPDQVRQPGRPGERKARKKRDERETDDETKREEDSRDAATRTDRPDPKGDDSDPALEDEERGRHIDTKV